MAGTLHETLIRKSGEKTAARDRMVLDDVGLDKLASALEGMSKKGSEDLDPEVVQALTGAVAAAAPATAKKGKPA